MSKLIGAPLFFALFGLMFLYFGVQRLWGAATAEKKSEAVLWGSVGVVLAAVFFGITAWFFTGDAAEIERQQIEIMLRSRRP